MADPDSPASAVPVPGTASERADGRPKNSKATATPRAQRLATALRDNLKRRKAAATASRPEKPRN
ncbi:MAG: hypothetical protein JHC81_13930 [Brevundimonas sp.]|uniref:hypothetical protein n=1 Tax=Brevundimonas sp. TaxID=1871086 RepID=UPI001A25E280|nr:hypothetical protein [Brevundimonas sp.]MBJ7448627.1 hypothetical protein [Brevundimonas sp.]